MIELCQKVSQTQESSLDDEVPVDMLHNYWEGTYASARKAVVGLLGKAVINDDNAIEHQYLEDVRNILMQLCDDLNPSQEYEAKWGTAQGRDYLNLALNVIRADAIKSLIHYALHLARVVEKDEAVSHLLPTGIRIEPDVLEKLIEKLDKNNDPAKSVHLNFGLYLPNLIYLDKKIFLSHLEDIFPRDVEKIDYWEAAWDGYMFRSEFFGGLYSHLKPYYYYALDQLEDSIDGRAGSENSQHRIAGHFALLYSNGEETFNDENSLVKRFFAIASDDLRATFVKALSPSPAKDPIESESDEWQRLKEFLNWRYASIQDAGNPDDYKKELATFLLWVPHLPEPLENFYEIIEASVLVAEPPYLISLFEYLVKVVDEHTRFVMCLYEKNIMRGFPPYFRGARDEEVQIILETAIKSDDEESKDSAIRVINHFGERGDDRYRSLLKIT